MRRLRGLAVGAMPIALGAASCALIAGLDDFAPEDADSGSGGLGASAGAGLGGSSSAGASATSSGGTASSATGGATSTGTGGAVGDTCNNDTMDGTETDVDCGGSACPDCPLRSMCSAPGDCVTGVCTRGRCACNTHLLISEVRTRGASSAADEFVELYNPTPAPIVLDNTFVVDSRSSGSMQYTNRWVGGGESIPPYHHYLIVGGGFSQATLPDATLTSGITDAGSLVLKQGAIVIDAFCFCYNPSTCTAVTNNGYKCEGEPATNANMDVMNGVTASMERKAFGSNGSCVDTDDSQADFDVMMPGDPQALASMPTP
jgi:hypothetical protein